MGISRRGLLLAPFAAAAAQIVPAKPDAKRMVWAVPIRDTPCRVQLPYPLVNTDGLSTSEVAARRRCQQRFQNAGNFRGFFEANPGERITL